MEIRKAKSLISKVTLVMSVMGLYSSLPVLIATHPNLSYKVLRFVIAIQLITESIQSDQNIYRDRRKE